MTDTQGLAVRLVALQELGKRVTEAFNQTKELMAETMIPGERKIAALSSGVEVGGVTYTRGRSSARVVNPALLTEWVLLNYPDEVVPQVRPAFQAAILAATVKAGMPMCPDGTADVPGIELGTGTPYLTVKGDDQHVADLVDAIRANALLAIEGPE